MGTFRQEGGRTNQKRRTREAIVKAAASLLAQGMTPTVGEVADAAAVSRATAYRYFPTQDYLLSEAALNSTREEIDAVIVGTDDAASLEGRLDAVIRALQEQTAAQEGAFRTLLRLSLEAQPEMERDGTEPRLRRGGRRIDWIAGALEPIWEDLDAETRQRLTGALSLCIGIEALVVLRDICGFGPEQTVEISRWAAQAILRAGLDASAYSPHVADERTR